MSGSARGHRIRFDRQEGVLVVVAGKTKTWLEVFDDAHAAERKDVAEVSASEARRALVSSRMGADGEDDPREVSIGVASSEYEVIDLEYAQASPVSIVLTASG